MRFAGGMGVVAISVAVFLGSFALMMAVAGASKPPTVELLAANRDLPAGSILSEEDLRVIRAFEDETSAAFVRADELDKTVGGLLALPIREGAPIPRDAIIAGSGGRFSALLAEKPGHVAFPVFLDEMNIIAPNITTFLPGDIVGVIVVVVDEPMRASLEALTPSPDASAPVTPTTEVTATVPISVRVPLAKSLFPTGVRVLAVLTPQTDPELGRTEGHPTLVLEVPTSEVERLALLLQQADKVIIAHFGKGEGFPERTPSFTFDDFIKQLQEDRQQILEGEP